MVVAATILAIGIVLWLVINYFDPRSLALLNPEGFIAKEEANLMLIAVSLMLIVAIPMWVMAFFFAWKYRAGNKHATYTPNWDRSSMLESLWWVVPTGIIMVLAVVTWKASHDLHPYKAVASSEDPITIQVVALRWKWLFIYPEQKIATVNTLQIPEDTPIKFELTADAPMSSFWIPKLGGQIYAMNGMATKLNLIADSRGEFPGYAAEINGRGFSGMKFITKATSKEEFDAWVETVKFYGDSLDFETFGKLSEPSVNDSIKTYELADPAIFQKVIKKYMPETHKENEHTH